MDVINKEVQILGSMGYGLGELDEALALMASGAVNRSRLISHRFSLDEVGQAFEAQGSGSAIKVMVLPADA